MTSPASAPTRLSNSAQSTVRRIVVVVLLFTLVVVTAIGVSDLIGRLIDPNAPSASDDPAGLALSLAFALVGGPLAALLWWLTWRRLADPAEHGSWAWGIYLTAASTLALIVAVTSALSALSAAVDGDWRPGEVATAIVWSAVWLWHRWLRRHRTKRPLRLSSVPVILASWFGLVVGSVALAGALGGVFAEALRGLTVSLAGGEPWWRTVVQSVVWAIGGGLVWWWHWFREGGRGVSTVFGSVALVVVGILAASVAALAGAGTLVFVALRFAFHNVEPLATMIDPIDTALASSLVGGMVWAFHRRIVRTRPAQARGDSVRSASALVLSGVGVVATASGIGVIVNATLSALSPALVGSDAPTLLLGGVGSVLVGAPLWWIVWRPARGAVPVASAPPARRIYLVALFGISATTALVTLLLIGFRIFEVILADLGGAGGLVDRIRAPLGILVATVLVAGYHFAIWRRDRASAGPPSEGRAIRRVILILFVKDELVARAIRDATGAAVTVWIRARDDAAPDGNSGLPAVAADEVLTALAAVHAERVLVIDEGPSGLRVIALAD